MSLALRVVQLSYAFDRDLATPEALALRYDTLVAWSAALLGAGAARADVVQRAWCDAELVRAGVTLRLRRAGAAARPRPWTALGRLHHAVRELVPEVVHVNGLIHPWGLPALRRALPRATALVLQDHAALGPPRDALRRWLWRRAFACADGFLFTAEGQAEPWRAAGLIVPRHAVHAVPEGSRAIRPPERGAARRETFMQGAPALLWVGRLHAVKDPLTVLDGFEQAQDALPRAHLTMVFGSDELLDAVCARCARPGLRQRVTLVGRVPSERMAAYYGSADAFVLGSRKEGSGYALIEALACGLVPVVTDIPAFRALTADGRHGRLWPPGDAAACAAALRTLGTADLAAEGAQGRAHFERELAWPAVGARALDAYRATLQRSRV